MKLLCEVMGIQRSSFYNWKQSITNPSPRTKTLLTCTAILSEYHTRYPSHDYRWLNAKIRLDTKLEMTDSYALKCCRNAGIYVRGQHYRYRRQGEADKVYPNLLMSEMQTDGPGQCVVSCSAPLELENYNGSMTLFVDFWNYEIIAWQLRSSSGMTCGPEKLPFLEQHPEFSMLMQAENSALYAAVSFQELMPMYSMPMSGIQVHRRLDVSAMEAISGWLRIELLSDLCPEQLKYNDSPEQLMETYRTFFNEQRPLYTLGYLTPRQYREKYLPAEA